MRMPTGRNFPHDQRGRFALGWLAFAGRRIARLSPPPVARIANTARPGIRHLPPPLRASDRLERSLMDRPLLPGVEGLLFHEDDAPLGDSRESRAGHLQHVFLRPLSDVD